MHKNGLRRPCEGEVHRGAMVAWKLGCASWLGNHESLGSRKRSQEHAGQELTLDGDRVKSPGATDFE
jgi:hypothetical protein